MDRIFGENVYPVQEAFRDRGTFEIVYKLRCKSGKKRIKRLLKKKMNEEKKKTQECMMNV